MYDYKGVPLRELKGKAKFQYIWDYYKIQITAVTVIVIIIISMLHSVLSRKNTVLTAALLNVIISEENLADLENSYLESRGYRSTKDQITWQQNLVVSSEGSTVDSSLSYTSEVKLLAMLTGKQLDIVIMDPGAYQVFSDNGYLKESISLEGTSLAEKLGFDGDVYAGIIGNSQHIEEAEAFLNYIS